MRPKSAIYPSGKRCAAALALAVIATCPVVVSAQTSGSWAFNGDGSWSEAAKWDPSVPNAGGVATFSQHNLQSAVRNITLDIPVTISSLVFDSAYQWLIPVTGSNSLTLTGSATIATPRSNASTPSLFASGHVISRPITGLVGLLKTGPGNLTLNATNTYVGGTTISGGSMRTTVGDVCLGAPGGTITLAGGSLRPTNVALSSARPITLGAGGGTFEMFITGTFSGVISGSGTLNKTISQPIAFQAANTYTGATRFQHRGTLDQGVTDAGTIFFNNGGSALSTPSIESGGTIVLNNFLANSNNRLPSVPMTLHAGGLALVGNPGTFTSEAVGAVTTDVGISYFTVTPDTAQSASLTLSSLTRSNRSVQVYRGTGLGGTPAANVGNIFITSAPALTGGGGAAGSFNISIIRGAVGSNSTTSGGSDFVTYGANGVRPLSSAANEYRPALGFGAATDNVLLSSTATATVDETMNSLILPGGTLSGTKTLTLTSGMLINSINATHTPNFNFGAAEGIFHTNSSGTFTGVISGSNGFTKSGGSDCTFTASNTYTGNTTVLAGALRWTAAAVPVNTTGPFGSSTDPIILQPGGATGASLLYTGTGTTVFDRDVIVRGTGAAAAGFGVVSNQSVTMNGNITLERQLSLDGSTTGLFQMNGTISGVGRLMDHFSTVSTFTKSNTYSGGTEINTGSYYLGNDAALGSGTIWFIGAGTIGATGAPRTVANPIVVLANFGIGSNALVGGGQNIKFTGDVNLGGGNSGANDGPYTITVPAGVTAEFAGAIHDGGIVKAGGGTMRLTGTSNSYSGGTVVNGGTLLVDNTSGSATGTNFVTASAGTVGGTGVIAGALTLAAGASLAPGDSPGTLTSGALVLNNTSSLLYELGTPGVVGSGSNDLMVVNGALTLDGVLTVSALPGFSPGAYTLMTYTGALTNNIVTVNPLPFSQPGAIDLSQPGKVRLIVNPAPGAGDFDGDTDLDAADIDALMHAMQGSVPPALAMFDLNHDNLVKSTPFSAGSDSDVWVLTLKNTRYGDANLDGRVNSLDFNLLASHFNQSGQGWAQGDFNGNGVVNGVDFNQIATNFGFIAASPPVLATLAPEPAGSAVFILAPVALSRRRRARHHG